MIREVDTSGMLNAVRALIQHLCTKVPDRAEYRTKISQVSTPCTVALCPSFAIKIDFLPSESFMSRVCFRSWLNIRFLQRLSCNSYLIRFTSHKHDCSLWRQSVATVAYRALETETNVR